MAKINIQALSFLILIIAWLPSGRILAQDTIVFLGGRVMEGTVVEVDSQDVRIEVQKRKKKKIVATSTQNIFAIRYGDGRTAIFYEPLSPEEYSVREMQFLVLGEQDATQNTKAPWLFAGGFVLGGASTTVLGPFFGLGPLLPYALLAGSVNSKIKENAISNPDLLREDTYITGYVTKARNIKIQQAIKGSIAGYLAGLAAIAINTQINRK